MRISFKRSGGFAGLPGQNQSLEIDSEKLPHPKAQELERLVEETRPFDHPSEQKSASKMRDGFQYDLTLDAGDRTHSLKLTDGAVPDKLQPLIEWLSQEVNEDMKGKQPKSKS
ncbi:MAG: hypothetical protein QOF02_951 [Blastocatellia bacterium]|jgi:hypothetical protein|nr:hypothetical protein [Blastocatellia bacterium]